ncbi:MAG: hypothetical protein ACKE9I_03725 [Methylophagaceae bacterium]
MLNYMVLENTVMNVVRKFSLLGIVATFVLFIYVTIMAAQLALSPPEAPPQAEPVDIVWADPAEYLFDTYGEYTLTDSELHSDSDVKAIIDKLILPKQHSEISILIVNFLMKHPGFDIGTADMAEIQAKVEEYAEWMESMLEEYDDVEHFGTGLLQWVKDFTSDPEFYNFAYSRSLDSEELEFGELEDAVDDVIIAYSQQYDGAIYLDDEIVNEYQYELYEHQEEIDVALDKMWDIFVIFGAFLLLILLFRIEGKLVIKAN